MEIRNHQTVSDCRPQSVTHSLPPLNTVYFRDKSRPALGRDYKWEERRVLVVGSPSAALVTPLPNFVGIDAAEMADPEVPHVAVIGCFWRHWVKGDLRPDSNLLFVDPRPAIAGLIARSLPRCPPVTVVTPATPGDAHGEVDLAYKRFAPPGETP